MYHLVFVINFQIHFASLVCPVSIHLLIHLSRPIIVIIDTVSIHHFMSASLWNQLPNSFRPVSLTILVLIHLLIHFSTHFSHHPHSRHPSLLLSFTPDSKPTFSTNPSHLRFLLPTGLPHDNGTGLDLLRSSFYF